MKKSLTSRRALPDLGRRETEQYNKRAFGNLRP